MYPYSERLLVQPVNFGLKSASLNQHLKIGRLVFKIALHQTCLSH